LKTKTGLPPNFGWPSFFMQETPATPPRVTQADVARALLERRRTLLAAIAQVEDDEQAAEDLLSLVTVWALSRAHLEFRGESDLVTYLAGMARHMAARHARKCARRKRAGLYYEHELPTAWAEAAGGPAPQGAQAELSPGAGLEGLGYATASAEDAAAHRQALGLVQRELQKLARKSPAAYRCWKMRRLEEQDYGDIARSEGLSEAGVRSQVHRFARALEAATQLRPAELFA
jgi:RNA polymerase sigma factor (sigma-70 family)